MSKYEPLRAFLTGIEGGRVSTSFQEIESVIGFRLPTSARKHAAWWANTPESHSQAKAWLDAGWHTWAINLPAETVEFRRVSANSAGASEGAAAFVGPTLHIPMDRLTLAGQVLIERYAQEEGGDIVAAVARALQEAAMARRRALLDDMARRAPKIEPDIDVVEVIRQMREERDEQILGS